MPGNERMVSQILARVPEGLLLLASSKHDFGILSPSHITTYLPTNQPHWLHDSKPPSPSPFVVSLPKANW